MYVSTMSSHSMVCACFARRARGKKHGSHMRELPTWQELSSSLRNPSASKEISPRCTRTCCSGGPSPNFCCGCLQRQTEAHSLTLLCASSWGSSIYILFQQSKGLQIISTLRQIRDARKVPRDAGEEKNGRLLYHGFFLGLHCNENPLYVFLFWE
jgi:hypothetical protein